MQLERSLAHRQQQVPYLTFGRLQHNYSHRHLCKSIHGKGMPQQMFKQRHLLWVSLPSFDIHMPWGGSISDVINFVVEQQHRVGVLLLDC